MTEKTLRRPVANFFVKKSIQFRIIGEIILVIFISTLLTTLLLAFIYNAKSQAGSFYYMSNNIMEDLRLQSILGLVLPALIAAQIVSLLIAVGVGLFSSRKVAVPLYKIEKWAAQLKSGNLNTRLAFRETREMRDLTDQCNAVADTYRQIFMRVEKAVNGIEAGATDPARIQVEVAALKDILDTFRFEQD